MTPDGSKRTWGFGLTVAILVLALVFFGAINVLRWTEARRHAADTTGDAAANLPADAASPDNEPASPAGGPASPAVGAAPTAEGSSPTGSGPAAQDRMQTPEESPPAVGHAARDGAIVGNTDSPGDIDRTSPPPGSSRTASAPAQSSGSAGGSRPGSHSAAAPTGPSVAPAAATPGPAPAPEEDDGDTAGPDTTSDRTPPALTQIRFDPPVVEGGNPTRMTIQATDNLSGVKSVRGEIQSPSGQAVLSLYLQETQGGAPFSYVVNIPAAAETGIWFVKWLYLTDVANNSALIQVASATTAPPGGTFSVSSTESDSIAPEVLGLSFDKDVIEDEDRNVVRVEVRDDLSGVASVSGACRSPSGAALIPFTCALNEDSGLWEGAIPIPASADCGVWSVQQVNVQDKAGNSAHVTFDAPGLGHAGFRIAPRPDCDSSPPTLDGFSLSQTIVPVDAVTEIQIRASVHDVGSGAATLTGWFEGPVSEGGQVPRNHFTCTPDPDHPEAPWTGSLLVPQFAPKGLWKVRVVRLEDKALNAREYTPADPVLAGGVFEVR
ncbi:MAG TPA: hypothetical protein VGS03_21020 [Candidatus Polarisedimenticolia bacterium]|jgi:hypothetical protein|nr:hypothetical protein [Candidatus Polarisedimenticolia bacterium]